MQTMFLGGQGIRPTVSRIFTLALILISPITPSSIFSRLQTDLTHHEFGQNIRGTAVHWGGAAMDSYNKLLLPRQGPSVGGSNSNSSQNVSSTIPPGGRTGPTEQGEASLEVLHAPTNQRMEQLPEEVDRTHYNPSDEQMRSILDSSAFLRLYQNQCLTSQSFAKSGLTYSYHTHVDFSQTYINENNQYWLVIHI